VQCFGIMESPFGCEGVDLVQLCIITEQCDTTKRCLPNSIRKESEGGAVALTKMPLSTAFTEECPLSRRNH
jgi:hypothetical protein